MRVTRTAHQGNALVRFLRGLEQLLRLVEPYLITTVGAFLPDGDAETFKVRLGKTFMPKELHSLQNYAY